MKLVVDANNLLREDDKILGKVTAFAVDKQVLHGGLKAIEVVLNHRLVGPVEVANELDEARGIIRSGTRLLKVLELPKRLRVGVWLVKVRSERGDESSEIRQQERPSLANGHVPAARVAVTKVNAHVANFVVLRDERGSLKFERVVDLEQETVDFVSVPFEDLGFAELGYADRTRCRRCRNGRWSGRWRRESGRHRRELLDQRIEHMARCGGILALISDHFFYGAAKVGERLEVSSSLVESSIGKGRGEGGSFGKVLREELGEVGLGLLRELGKIWVEVGVGRGILLRLLIRAGLAFDGIREFREVIR